MKENNRDEALTQKEFAKRLGVRPSYVSALKRRGRLVLTQDGRKVLYRASLERIQETRDPSKITPKPPKGEPAPEAAAAMGRESTSERQEDDFPAQGGVMDCQSENGRESAQERQEDDFPARSGVDYQSARARREHFNAKLAELEYRKTVGLLVEIDLVREVILNAGTTLRTHLEQMSERLAPRVLDAETESEIRAVILEEVETALGDMADTFRRHVTGSPEIASGERNTITVQKRAGQ